MRDSVGNACNDDSGRTGFTYAAAAAAGAELSAGLGLNGLGGHIPASTGEPK